MGLFSIVYGEEVNDIKAVISSLKANIQILEEYPDSYHIVDFIQANIDQIKKIHTTLKDK